MMKISTKGLIFIRFRFFADIISQKNISYIRGLEFSMNVTPARDDEGHLEPILPNFVFLHFPIFAVKLECL